MRLRLFQPAEFEKISNWAESERTHTFCLYLENEEKEGFIKFVIVNPEDRGCGYGTEFMKMILTHAFSNPDIQNVRLNVFEVNEAARKCYKKVGFQERNYYPERLKKGSEYWGAYSMIVYRPQE